MTISLKFYTTSGLSTEATSLSVTQAADGSGSAVDFIVFLASLTTGNKFQAQSSPGVANIVVSIADSASGSGVAASAVKLAISSGGLDTATAGASLSLGATLLSGAANLVAIHVRIDTPALAIGNYTDLSLALNTLIESAA